MFLVHPRTRKVLSTLDGHVPGNILLQAPVGYLDMLVLEENARLILTDSPGRQKQAYLFGVPCVTLRPETEWVETVVVGWNVVTESDSERVIAALRSFNPNGCQPAIFGDGTTARRVVELLS